METIKIKKCRENALLPVKQTDHSAGYDIFANLKESAIIKPNEHALIPSGFALELPPGYEAQVRPRSGFALKHKITVLNSPGTIDADYRGEVKIILINFGKENFTIINQMRIAQLVINRLPEIRLEETSDLTSTKRSSGGFGHTGITK